ncbi:hypothetical protein [Variovorax atrisoli]|uniref:hypothetical protein n=1 Tax=Variovorax atrisoli TaxID=3394203 RepID=UPI003396E5D2
MTWPDGYIVAAIREADIKSELVVFGRGHIHTTVAKHLIGQVLIEAHPISSWLRMPADARTDRTC